MYRWCSWVFRVVLQSLIMGFSVAFFMWLFGIPSRQYVVPKTDSLIYLTPDTVTCVLISGVSIIAIAILLGVYIYCTKYQHGIDGLGEQIRSLFIEDVNYEIPLGKDVYDKLCDKHNHRPEQQPRNNADSKQRE